MVESEESLFKKTLRNAGVFVRLTSKSRDEAMRDILNALADAGKLMHEHGRLGEGGAALSGHNGTPAAIRAKIKELEASEKMKDPNHPQYPEAVKQLNTLIESLGNEPIDAGGAQEF